MKQGVPASPRRDQRRRSQPLRRNINRVRRASISIASKIARLACQTRIYIILIARRIDDRSSRLNDKMSVDRASHVPSTAAGDNGGQRCRQPIPAKVISAILTSAGVSPI